MKFSLALTAVAAFALKASADNCFSEKLGYDCCSKGAKVRYTDKDGNWGVEHGEWCGIVEEPSLNDCFSVKLGYKCCSKDNTKVRYTDKDGKWGVEHGEWCGITSDESTTDPKEGYVDFGPIFSTNGNPFSGADLYGNPEYVENVTRAIDNMTNEDLIAKAEKVKEYPTAIWLNDSKTVREKLESNLQNAASKAAANDKPVLSVFVLNNIPGGDCHSLLPYSEFDTNDNGYESYLTEYVQVIEDVLKTYQSQPVALIVEPNSLVNLVVNAEYTPACKDAEKYIWKGLIYIIEKLGVLPHVSLYLDIGNTYNLGYEDYIEKYVNTVSEIIEYGVPGNIRGFASNVGKYAPWENDGANAFESIPDEKRYLETMYHALTAAGVKNVHFIEDSSRNGKMTSNQYPVIDCNEKDVSMGMKPQANPDPDSKYIDAFFWVKPVGESVSKNLDDSEFCLRDAPESGEWFQKHFEIGLANANPSL